MPSHIETGNHFPVSDGSFCPEMPFWGGVSESHAKIIFDSLKKAGKSLVKNVREHPEVTAVVGGVAALVIGVEMHKHRGHKKGPTSLQK